MRRDARTAAASLAAGLLFGAAPPAKTPAPPAKALVPLAKVARPRQGGLVARSRPVFPPDNWWNLDISAAPVDARSSQFLAFIGANRALHPDFGGEETPGGPVIYGFPYIVVSGTQPRKAVQFLYSEESDGVEHATDTSLRFYPIPDEAVTTPHWIEGGPPGKDDPGGDRHVLIVDEDDWCLYELWAARFKGGRWEAGSGAFFDMKTNDRRPEDWTSADAAGLAIFPGLVRYEEAFGTEEIEHAFRVTLRATNGHVFPASHSAASTPGALPMGARLRLKAGKDISRFPPEVQRILRAFKRHGLIVADNGSDMYVSGTFDTRWDNRVLNPAFGALTAGDFEVVELGYRRDGRPEDQRPEDVVGASASPMATNPAQ